MPWEEHTMEKYVKSEDVGDSDVYISFFITSHISSVVKKILSLFHGT